ncbi:hypothetical protein IW262DRAFT_258577 [Armillaria fumosa]|nr:hypothetical protein IW262DRAFT_258577 [Armillaria fumosa]
MSKSTFPYEIWLNIAHFIPPLVLEDLFSVNSALFHLAMEQRYRQISFAYLSRKMLRLLVRLKDPAVAKRVRILHIHPHFVNEDFDTPASSLFSFRKLFGRKSRPPRIKNLDDLITIMGDVLGSLPHLTEYHIAWVGLQSAPAPFLCTPFGSSPLTKLTLEITLENLQTLLKSQPSFFGTLRELDLFLRTDHALDLAGYDMILSRTLAPMINSLSLQTLSLRLWEPIDLSPFFSALYPQPKLHTLSLSIPLTSPHLGNPDSVATFLNMHSRTLRSLSLRATDLSSPIPIVDDSLSHWMQRAFYAVNLTSLSSLELAMGSIPYESAQLCISRFPRTLANLVITGRHLSMAEVRGLRIPRLRRLRMGPVTLSPQLMDYLAARVAVQRLELVVSDVVPRDGEEPIYEDRDQEESQVCKFFQEMGERRYEGWGVRHLEVARNAVPWRRRYEDGFSDLWSRCVPSLREVAV